MPVTKIATVTPRRKSTALFNEFSKYENGRVRKLRFDINALADFEQETGMGFGLLMKQRAAFASARAMVWAGLKHEDRSLTIESVGGLIHSYLNDPEATDHSIDELLMIVIKAAVDQGAFGKIQEPKKNDEDEDEEEEKPLVPNASGQEVIDLPASSVQSDQTSTTPETDGNGSGGPHGS